MAGYFVYVVSRSYDATVSCCSVPGDRLALVGLLGALGSRGHNHVAIIGHSFSVTSSDGKPGAGMIEVYDVP
jgi:hypothetical protein